MLEIEGTEPKHLYVMLRGEVLLFKRPEAMYDADGKRIKIDQIEYLTNPKDSG